ncbi:ABC transporter substrate-binding protein [Fodinibius sediminis]|nr:ABC transporter substrate-binding protein [Fodinibius sediminis]
MRSLTLYLAQPFLYALTILLFSGFSPDQSIHAQSFERGVTLYQQGEYAQAAALFDQIHSDRGLLFAGKAYLGLKDYATAKSRLLNISDASTPRIATEANYTLSLVHFKQKDFGEALNRLFVLASQEINPEIASESQKLYRDLLNYLTFDQRREILDNAESDTVKYDLVSTSLGRVEREEAQILFTSLRNATDEVSSDQLEKISSIISDKARYRDLQADTALEAPEGLTYNIGIALPAYSPEKNEYPVAQGLYLGYALAVEQFNKQHDIKAGLTYHNTGIESDSAQQALEVLSSTGVEAVIGPLFSERAKSMAAVSAQHRTPILAPLANSESIAEKGGYFFQVNPTFSTHGQNMARYAVQALNLDRVAVIAERGTLGEISARAFREEMEQLDAEVPYFFSEELGSRGYGLSQYTRYFSEDRPAMADSPVSAVYAPFTGDSAPALMDLLLGQLNSLESNVTVLGSQEWANANFSSGKIGNRPVYFTESFYSRPGSTRIQEFESAFRDRFAKTPNRFAMIGYDTAMFLLQTLDRVVNPALLKKGLAEQPAYNGLVTNIHFDGTNINQRLMLFKITDTGSHLISESL